MMDHTLERALESGPAGAPGGTRIYAVGDIHGAAKALEDALERIHEDSRRSLEARREVFVALGDYVDRGDDTHGVLEQLLALDEALPGMEHVLLEGNHEEWLKEWLDEPGREKEWLNVGGRETCLSYGVAPPGADADEEELQETTGKLRNAMGGEHLKLIHSLRLLHIEGRYVFSHTGGHPYRRPYQQRRKDLLWGTMLFRMTKTYEAGWTAVHGHWTRRQVEMGNDRINLDAGAHHTGVLPVLRLEGEERKLI